VAVGGPYEVVWDTDLLSIDTRGGGIGDGRCHYVDMHVKNWPNAYFLAVFSSASRVHVCDMICMAFARQAQEYLVVNASFILSVTLKVHIR